MFSSVSQNISPSYFKLNRRRSILSEKRMHPKDEFLEKARLRRIFCCATLKRATCAKIVQIFYMNVILIIVSFRKNP